jgi:uncharacterized protein (TIGR00369 family)
MLDNLLKELSKVFATIPFNKLLGLELDELGDNYVTMSFSMKQELIGNYMYGILHGGVISSVLDMAGGVAVMVAALHKHQGKNLEEIAAILGKSSTINLHIDYIRPGKGEKFIAKAYLIQAGNKISFARMELFNQDAVLIANGAGTYLVAAQ